MAEEYDIVVCGTGLVEYILSSLLSKDGNKVFHIDRNPFYGGEGTSLGLTSLWKLFRPGVEPPQELGADNEWNVDLIPKFVMTNGQLIKLLKKAGVSKYVDWKSVDSTYIYQLEEDGYFRKGGPKISKVPGTDKEVIKSDRMGLLERNHCRNLFLFVQNYNPKDTKTHGGLDLSKESFSSLIKKFNLSENIVEFIGHSVVFCPDDDFVDRPAVEIIRKISLYLDSCIKYDGLPFQYPTFGLKSVLEGFSRVCSNYGETFISGKDVDEILYDDQKKVCGVKSNGGVIKCKTVICNPSYMVRGGNNHKVRRVGKVIRSICILNHPIDNTNNNQSLQIIIPQKQIGRKSDIFITVMSNAHQVCKSGYYVAVISTLVETEDPEKELKPALDLLSPVLEKFVTTSDLYVPNSNFSDNVFITTSLDSQSHFECAADNVIELYKSITGQELDLSEISENEGVLVE